MCQMKVVLEASGDQENIMENVTLLEASSEGITVTALFEEPRLVPGAMVKRIDFMKGLVTLAPVFTKE
ncbi:CooT family nickel-binding protein [Thermodesulfobacteriota bacterium]